MSGYKTFANNELLTAADVNGYLMAQVVARVDQAGRDAILVPEVGQVIERTDLNIGERWNGAVWQKTPLRFVGCHIVKEVSMGWATSGVKVPWRTTNKTDQLDTHNFHSTASPTRFTIPFTGWYDLSYSMKSSGIIATTATIIVNGTGISIGDSANVGASGAGTNVQSTGILRLNAGDYVELQITSVATGAGSWNPAACWFDLRYLGEY